MRLARGAATTVACIDTTTHEARHEPRFATPTRHATRRPPSAGPSWSRTAAYLCASRSASCATRRSPRTRSTTCSRPCSRAARLRRPRGAALVADAVLKNKIVDTVRRNAGIDSLDDVDADGAPRTASLPAAAPRRDRRATRGLARARRHRPLPPGLRDVMRLRILEDRSTERSARSSASARTTCSCASTARGSSCSCPSSAQQALARAERLAAASRSRLTALRCMKLSRNSAGTRLAVVCWIQSTVSRRTAAPFSPFALSTWCAIWPISA